MLKNLKSLEFWEAACARALRTALQGFLASAGTCAVIQDLNVPVIFSTTALAVLVSLATSIVAGLPEA